MRRVYLFLFALLASFAIWCSVSSDQTAEGMGPFPTPTVIHNGTQYAPLPYKRNVVICAGQSLGAGGGAITNDAGPLPPLLKISDSQSDAGWYWSGGVDASLGQPFWPALPTAEPGCLFTVVDSGTGVTSLTQPTWCTSTNCVSVDGNGVSYKCGTMGIAPFSQASMLDASTLTWQPYGSPARPVAGTSQPFSYPVNLLGESMCWAAELEIATLTGGSTIVTLEDAIGSQSTASISDGGSSNAWVSLTNELTADTILGDAGGLSVGAPFVFLTNGEQDQLNYSLVTDVLQYIVELWSSVPAITGQGTNPLVYASQQATSPQAITAPPFSAFVQIWLSRNYEDRYVLTQPKWIGPYIATNTQHETALGYQLNGEKNGEAASFDNSGNLSTPSKWRPVAPNDVSISSSTNLLATFDVPVPPLRFVDTFPGAQSGTPHQTGALSNVWSTSKGFEVIQNIANIIAATNASPIVIQTQQAHGLSSGAVVNIANVAGNGAANSQANSANFTITVIDSTHFSLNGSTGNGAYVFGGQVRLAVTAATNATPIAITTNTAHGILTGAVVSIDGVLGNTAANGNWVITKTGANSFTLNSSVGNGTYTAGGGVSVDLPITSVAIQNNNQVLVTTPSNIANGTSLAIASTPDDVADYSGNIPSRRMTNLADSDTFIGRYTGISQPNYGVISYDPVPMHVATVTSISPAIVFDNPGSPTTLTLKCNRGCANPTAVTLKAAASPACSGTTVATLTSVSFNDQGGTAVLGSGSYPDGFTDVCVTTSASPTALASGFDIEPLNLLTIFPPGNVGTSCAAVGVYLGSNANCSGGVSSGLTDSTSNAQTMPAVGSPTCTATGSSPTVQPTFTTGSGKYYDWGSTTNYFYYPGTANTQVDESICYVVVAKTSSTGPAEFVSANQWGPLELRMANTAPTNEPHMISNAGSIYAQWGSATTGAWHEYVACTTGTSTGTVKISVDNGTFVTTSVTSGNLTRTTGLNSIGASHGGASPNAAEFGAVGIITCPPSTFPASGDWTNAHTWASSTYGTP